MAKIQHIRGRVGPSQDIKPIETSASRYTTTPVEYQISITLPEEKRHVIRLSLTESETDDLIKSLQAHRQFFASGKDLL